MLWKKTRAGVAANLIICIAFLMSGGVSKVVGETLPAEPELLEIMKPNLINCSFW